MTRILKCLIFPIIFGISAGLSMTAKADTETDAKKIGFILLVIEPVMRANETIFRERREVERIRNKVTVENKALALSEADWLLRIKARYQLGATDSFDALLERVDGVKLPFLVAPLAIVANWNNPHSDLNKFFSDRIEVLNVAPGEENVRFRLARASVGNTSGKGGESVALMRAYLGIQNDAEEENNLLIAVIKDINRLSLEPVIQTKIKQIHDDLLSQKW